jgi:hypothetical protein
MKDIVSHCVAFLEQHSEGESLPRFEVLIPGEEANRRQAEESV